MIYLNQSETNYFGIYTPSKYTTAPTAYTMSLTSYLSDWSITGITISTVTASTRFNLFQLILSGASYQNLSAGTIHLDSNGMYEYIVYGDSTELERGIAVVSGNTETKYEYAVNNTKKYMSYNKNLRS